MSISQKRADEVEELLEHEILRFVQGGGTFNGNALPIGPRVGAPWKVRFDRCQACAVGAYLVNRAVRHTRTACADFAKEVGVSNDFAEGVYYGAIHDSGETDPSTCECGDQMEPHPKTSGHEPSPMTSCVCGRPATDEYRRQVNEALDDSKGG